MGNSTKVNPELEKKKSETVEKKQPTQNKKTNTKSSTKSQNQNTEKVTNKKTENNSKQPRVSKDPRKENNGKNTKKENTVLIKILRVFLVLALIGIACLAFLLYGPYDGFRDWYITSAMTTMHHQWLATMFYSQDTIDKVLEKNKIIEVDDVTDASLIKKADKKDKKEKEPKYANEYEKAVLERDPNNEYYKIIDIKGKTYNGYLAVVYDASKIHAMVTSRINVCGEYVTNMAKREGAILAINGGGFDDPNYSSNGGTPTGITFSRGKIITDKNNAGSGGLIGFTNDDVLTLGRITSSKAKELGIRDAVTCGPFLIINGESSEILGNGGWGQAARTVIGQRKDGIVLMLVLNGRNYTSGILGADMDDLIKIMENYGAYNAACLDGGTSSVMVENGEIINDPIDSTGAHKTRFVPTAFGVFKD